MANVDTARSVQDYTVELTNANTEYTQALPDGCKKFSVNVRSGGNVLHSFTSGRVTSANGPYNTIEAGAMYFENDLYLNKHVLCMASPTAGTIVEIRAWT